MDPTMRGEFERLRVEDAELERVLGLLRGQKPIDLPAHATLRRRLVAHREALATWRMAARGEAGTGR